MTFTGKLLMTTILFQLGSWFTELKAELSSEEVAETAENAERLLEQFSTQVLHRFTIILLENPCCGSGMLYPGSRSEHFSNFILDPTLKEE
jgi:hypothetical protein